MKNVKLIKWYTSIKVIFGSVCLIGMTSSFGATVEQILNHSTNQKKYPEASTYDVKNDTLILGKPQVQSSNKNQGDKEVIKEMEE